LRRYIIISIAIILRNHVFLDHKVTCEKSLVKILQLDRGFFPSLFEERVLDFGTIATLFESSFVDLYPSLLRK